MCGETVGIHSLHTLHPFTSASHALIHRFMVDVHPALGPLGKLYLQMLRDITPNALLQQSSTCTDKFNVCVY